MHAGCSVSHSLSPSASFASPCPAPTAHQILDMMGYPPSPHNKINIHVGGWVGGWVRVGLWVRSGGTRCRAVCRPAAHARFPAHSALPPAPHPPSRVYSTLGSKEDTMRRFAANFALLSPAGRGWGPAGGGGGGGCAVHGRAAVAAGTPQWRWPCPTLPCPPLLPRRSGERRCGQRLLPAGPPLPAQPHRGAPGLWWVQGAGRHGDEGVRAAPSRPAAAPAGEALSNCPAPSPAACPPLRQTSTTTRSVGLRVSLMPLTA